MRLLDVDVERARGRIAAIRDGFRGGQDAVDRQALHGCAVFLEIGIAEHADRARIAGDLAGDQVVLLALCDIGRIRPQRVAVAGEGVRIAVLERGHLRIGAATDLDHQIKQRIAGARAGGRTIDQDRIGRQRTVHIRPVDRGLFLAVGADGERAVDDLRGQREIDPLVSRHNEGDTVPPDLDLDDVLHAVADTAVEFLRRHAPRGVDDVSGLGALTLAEFRDPLAGAGRLDQGLGHTLVGGNEALGHLLGEGIDRRGADHGNRIGAGLLGLSAAARQQRDPRAKPKRTQSADAFAPACNVMPIHRHAPRLAAPVARKIRNPVTLALPDPRGSGRSVHAPCGRWRPSRRRALPPFQSVRAGRPCPSS